MPAPAFTSPSCKPGFCGSRSGVPLTLQSPTLQTPALWTAPLRVRPERGLWAPDLLTKQTHVVSFAVPQRPPGGHRARGAPPVGVVAPFTAVLWANTVKRRELRELKNQRESIEAVDSRRAAAVLTQPSRGVDTSYNGTSGPFLLNVGGWVGWGRGRGVVFGWGVPIDVICYIFKRVALSSSCETRHAFRQGPPHSLVRSHSAPAETFRMFGVSCLVV